MKTIRTIFLFTTIILCFQAVTVAIDKQQHTVTFNVNMETAEGFDPGEHNVFLTGSFTGWAEPGTAGSIEMSLVEKAGEGIIYTVTTQIPAGHNEYKYFSNAFGAGWAGGEWPGDPNRVIMVTGNTVINNTWGVIDEEDVFTVSFDVSNEGGETIEDAIITFNSIAYDPGTYVFENISPGTYNYSVAREGYVTHQDQLDVIDDDVHVEVVLTEGETPLHEIAFFVNMQEAATGKADFDPDIHDVYLTGTFNNWTTPGEDESYMMQAIDGYDNWYALSLELETGNYEYKYFLVENEPTWELGEWAGGADRAIHTDKSMPVFNLFGSPAIHMLDFLITDEDGDEIHEAVIKINSVESAPGLYFYPYVAPGQYDFTISKQGYVTYHDVFEVIDDDLLIHVELIADEEPTYTVSFTVTDEDGTDIHDAIITLHDNTNEAGNYVFEGITPGTYDFLVKKDGYEEHSGVVNVTNEDVIVDVVMNAIETMIIPQNMSEISVFPNPAAINLHIRANDELILDIKLIDMVGRIIHQADIMDNEYSMNVSDLKNGIYFVRINTQSSIVTERVIVNK